MHPYWRLLYFVGGVLTVGLAIGGLTAPDDWYQQLNKPVFNPPNWIFGPTWTLLYVAIGTVGWRLWHKGQPASLTRLWWLQLILNFSWSPVFFVLHAPEYALVLVTLLLATIIGFIALSWPRDRISALLFVPYAAWVTFAAVLNGAIWRLN